MRITAPVTDYVRASVLTAHGDMILRGAALPQRLAKGIGGQTLTASTIGDFLGYRDLFNLLTTQGDLWVKGPAVEQRIAAGAAGTYLQGKGAGVLPAYEATMPPLSGAGDILYQGPVVPTRRPIGNTGQVLYAYAAGPYPLWKDLFNLLTTQGDLWVRGAADPERIAAGALDTYFKGQGAATLPIYEKLHLKDTGVKIGNGTRAAAGAQAITGVGFLPSVVIFLTTDHTTSNQNWSVGFDDGTVHQIMYRYTNGTLVGELATASLRIFRDAGNLIYGSITALGADGFTITWSLVGACDCDFIYLCLP